MAEKDYSQHGEQVKILAHFAQHNPQTSHLLDIGAFVPDTFSNTRALIDLGWSGILIEPSPGPLQKLIEHYRQVDRIGLIQAVIGPTDGLVEFWDSGGDAVSSTELSHVQKWKAGYGVPYRKYLTYQISVGTLFSTIGYDFDFINVDTEATSARIFMLLPLAKLERCKMIIVEHDNQIDQIMERAKAHGYEYDSHDGENLIIKR